MKDKKIKKIPYGLANYARVVQKHCYYVDKTMYLKTILDCPRFFSLVGVNLVFTLA